jgi:hypothetical protein
MDIVILSIGYGDSLTDQPKAAQPAKKRSHYSKSGCIPVKVPRQREELRNVLNERRAKAKDQRESFRLRPQAYDHRRTHRTKN